MHHLIADVTAWRDHIDELRPPTRRRRSFRVVRSPRKLLDAERRRLSLQLVRAVPRSITDPERHGRFDDVIGRLPAIRGMVFDPLKLRPIRP